MRSSCTLPAPPNDEPKAESTAKKKRTSSLECLPVPTACRFESASNPKVCFIHKTRGRSPLPPLQTGKIGFRATHSNSASVPSRQGLAGGSSQALSPSPGCRRHQLSHLSHMPVCSQQQQFRRRVTLLAKETDALPGKSEGKHLLQQEKQCLEASTREAEAEIL